MQHASVNIMKFVHPYLGKKNVKKCRRITCVTSRKMAGFFFQEIKYAHISGNCSDFSLHDLAGFSSANWHI